MTITPLGAGQQVGRSCILLQYMGKNIMLDCGVDPGTTGKAGLPLLDADIVKPSQVDIVFITHFHLDHCAALPYFTERLSGFRGRIFATHSTVEVMKIMLSDYIRVTNNDGQESLYTEEDLHNCVDKIQKIDFKQSLTLDGVKFMLYPAGHVLGAAMVMLEIAGTRVLYTGDYSLEEDRHLMAAETPVDSPPDVLIVESTFGVQTHKSRETREALFTGAVRAAVARGGFVLIPVYALGRAQELLLILEEFWHANPDVQHVPVFFSSKLASKSLEVYKTYISQMNNRIQAQLRERNPWDFRYVHNLENEADELNHCSQAVVFASPGMLQSGFSRRLFDKWCEDERNAVVLTGYSVEGTLARDLLGNPKEVKSARGRKLAMNAKVDYVSFAAHADFAQTARFVEALQPPHIILVHGEKNEMRRLYNELARRYDTKVGFSVHMPDNSIPVTLQFEESRSVQVIGALADAVPVASERAQGLLVKQDFRQILIAPSDIARHTSLKVHEVHQTLHVAYRNTFPWLRQYVEAMHDGVEVGETATGQAFMTVAGVVRVEHSPPTRVILKWRSSPGADLVADSLVAVIGHADVSLRSLRIRASCCGKRRRCGSHGEHAPGTGEGEEGEGEEEEGVATEGGVTPGAGGAGAGTAEVVGASGGGAGAGAGSTGTGERPVDKLLRAFEL